jgi:hypothetical protein
MEEPAEKIPTFLARMGETIAEQIDRDGPSLCTLESEDVERLLKIAQTFFRLEREAARHVGSIICMRTHFTGDLPYVGWEGLGLALTEALDELDALKAKTSCPSPSA